MFPGNEHPPIYIYLSKPLVEPLEVARYCDLDGRSRQGKYHVDHMPSRQAVILYLKCEYPDLDDQIIRQMSDRVAAIAIPAEINRKQSATYGGRNMSQKAPDSYNLRAEIDKDFDAIKESLKELGATNEQLEEKRSEMHEINKKEGLY